MRRFVDGILPGVWLKNPGGLQSGAPPVRPRRLTASLSEIRPANVHSSRKPEAYGCYSPVDDPEETDPMSEAQLANGLHLPSLSVRAFRGIKSLSIPRLGRVTLLAGMNGAGKTTVLDAIRIYAARGSRSVLFELPERREEVAAITDEDGDTILVPDLASIFHEENLSRHARISIGPLDGADQLGIEVASPGDDHFDQIEALLSEKIEERDFIVLKVIFRDVVRLLPPVQFPHRLKRLRRLFDDGNLIREIKLESLGPGLPDNDTVARFWNHVVLTDEEDRALQALKLVLGSGVSRIAVAGSEQGSYGLNSQRVLVRLKDRERPIPLKSLGDGAVRLFGIALALANSRDGVLLIDEVENGIHHSVHPDFWRLVLRAAQDNNVQVIATTHGWDCVRGFAQAATELEDVEGVLVRLEREGGRINVVEYPEEKLMTAARHGIEVR